MKKGALTVLVVSAALFALGLAHLYRLRFETGDVYPEYSTLRADPLGAKALYESLDSLLPAGRHYRTLRKLPPGRDQTLFLLGLDHERVTCNLDDMQRFEAFAADGGRVVLTLFPKLQRPRLNRFQTTPPPGTRAKKGDQPGEEDEGDERPITEHFKKRWGVELDYEPLPPAEKGAYQSAPARRQAAADLPEELAWHSALYFSTATNWNAIYARTNARTVVLERRFGRGSIVLCSDSWLLSNEALLKDRQPAFLAWLAGPARRVVFDETHLGVSEDPGVATLAREYRLHGLFAGLLLLAALFVWKNSLSFLPPSPRAAPGAEAGLVQGRDSAAGFNTLLRRSIPPDQILKVCLEQWQAHCAHAGRPSAARLEQMQAVIDAENARPPRERDAVATYRKFCRILSRKGFFTEWRGTPESGLGAAPLTSSLSPVGGEGARKAGEGEPRGPVDAVTSASRDPSEAPAAQSLKSTNRQ